MGADLRRPAGFRVRREHHPLMRSGEMQVPGPFVKNYPAMTAMGFLMLHLLYGVVVGGLYEVWA